MRLSVLALSLLFFCFPASADDDPYAVHEFLTSPQTQLIVDEFGVDLSSSSSLSFPGARVSIGDDSSGLVHHSGKNRYHNYTGSNNNVGTLTSLEVKPSGSDYYQYLQLDFNGRSERFQNVGTSGKYRNVTMSGGELECSLASCNYTDIHGGIAEIELSSRHTSPVTNRRAGKQIFFRVGAVLRYVKPDGEEMVYHYRNQTAAVLSYVSSSLGWGIKYSGEFVGRDSSGSSLSRSESTEKVKYSVQAANLSHVYCGTDGELCAGEGNWPESILHHQRRTIRVANSDHGQFIGPSYRTFSEITSQVENMLGHKDNFFDAKDMEWEGTYTYTSFAGVEHAYKKSARWSSGANNSMVSIPGGGQIKVASIGNYSTDPDSGFYGGDYYWVDGPYTIEPHGSSERYVLSAKGPIGEVSFEASRWDIPTSDHLLEVSGHQSKLTKFVDRLGRATHYKYHNIHAGLLSHVLEPDFTGTIEVPTGGYTKYDYDNRGNIIAISKYPKNGGQPIVRSASYAPSCNVGNRKYCNKPMTITSATGVITSYSYWPEHGGIKSVKRAPVSGVQSETYYAYKKLTSKILNASGVLVNGGSVWRLTSISECATSHLRSCVGTADEKLTSFEYKHNNLLKTALTESLGDESKSLTTRYYYDESGSADGEFDGWGNLVKVDGPMPGDSDATFYTYDALRRLTLEVGHDPDGQSGPAKRREIKTMYNPDGKVILKEIRYEASPDAVERCSEYPIGTLCGAFTRAKSSELSGVQSRVISTYEDGSGLLQFEHFYEREKWILTKEYTYDSRMRLDTVTKSIHSSEPSEDRITKYFYDDTGALLRTESVLEEPRVKVNRKYNYRSDNGLLASLEDGLGNTTFYKYDNFNRNYKTIFPNPDMGQFESATDYEQVFYSGAAVSSSRLRDGTRVHFSYDTRSRLKCKSLAPNCSVPLETFKYDNIGRVTEHRSYIEGVDLDAAYTEFKFNALGWKTAERTGSSSSNIKREIWLAYNNYGQRERLTYTDGFFVDYNYKNGNDAGFLLQSIHENGNANKTIASFNYDKVGRRKSLDRNGVAETRYLYDGLNRLVNLETKFIDSKNDIRETFAYNGASQLEKRTHVVNDRRYLYPTQPQDIDIDYGLPNALNQYVDMEEVLGDGGVTKQSSFSYDGLGNMTRDGRGEYSYNLNNLMLSANRGERTQFFYDSENRLSKIVTDEDTTGFIYDGGDLIAEVDKHGNITARYVHGPNIDDPIVWYEGSGTTKKSYLVENRQGSVVAVAQGFDSGSATVHINSYDEYGVPELNNYGRFQYTGQVWIGNNVGLYHYKARVYDPELGRFLQTDPIGYADGMNMYAYVGNDPMNMNDPTGLARCSSSLSETRCNQALDAADSARADAERAGSGLNDLAGKVADGTELSEADQQALDVVGERFGSKFTSAKGLKRLAKGLNKAASKIGERGSGAILRHGGNKNPNPFKESVPNAYVMSAFGGRSIYLNDKFFNFKYDQTRSYVMLHEGSHLAGAWRDNYISDGINPLFNKSSAKNNADTYACAVYPASCGY